MTNADVIGDMAAWGTHFCLFYETKEDLLDVLVTFCKSGLEKGEYCLWIVAEPLTIEEATFALKEAVPDLDHHLADARVEIVSARDVFLHGGKLDSKWATDAIYTKLAGVSARCHAGIRVTGDTSWVTKEDWTHYCQIEEGINEVIGDQRLVVLCTFPLVACGAFEILDTVRAHQFVVVRRHGVWEIVESAALKRAKAEIQQFNNELEQRVIERTSQLMKTSEALREAQAELARVSRVTTMGELAASIAHEINQPLTAVTNNGSACLRLLADGTLAPDVLRRVLEEIVADGTRASAVIARIRAFIKKAPLERKEWDINEVIQEVLTLAGPELQKNRILVDCELTKPLPLVEADRVQLQQVLLNLVINGMEAMTGVTDRPRALCVRSELDESGNVLVTVCDSGIGLGSDADRLFATFFTTKADGMGMGLPISRSIIEGHGGLLWAASNSPHGAMFSFTLPAAGASAP